MSNVNLTEVFALPINTVKVGNVLGIDLYTSDSLKAKFIKSVQSTTLSHYIPNIERMVEKSIIIPVFASKNMIAFLKRKFPLFTSTDNDNNTNIMGCCSYANKSIYIIIDNNSNILGITNNNVISSLVIHELMHLFCTLRPHEYLHVFKSYLVTYYTAAFRDIFNAEVPKEEMIKIINTICLKYELGKEFALREPVMYLFEELKKYSKLPTKELYEHLRDYILAWHYATSDNNDISEEQYLRFDYTFSHLYSKVFSINVGNKGCFQEILTTSEVIATLAEQGRLLNDVKKIAIYLEKKFAK